MPGLVGELPLRERECSGFSRGTSTYGGVWRWCGAGISGERAAQQAEGIEVKRGRGQPELESLELTSGRGVASRSLGLTKLIWML